MELRHRVCTQKNIRTPISFVDTEGGSTARPEYFNFSIVTFDGFSNVIIIAVSRWGESTIVTKERQFLCGKLSYTTPVIHLWSVPKFDVFFIDAICNLWLLQKYDVLFLIILGPNKVPVIYKRYLKFIENYAIMKS